MDRGETTIGDMVGEAGAVDGEVVAVVEGDAFAAEGIRKAKPRRDSPISLNGCNDTKASGNMYC